MSPDPMKRRKDGCRSEGRFSCRIFRSHDIPETLLLSPSLWNWAPRGGVGDRRRVDRAPWEPGPCPGCSREARAGLRERGLSEPCGGAARQPLHQAAPHQAPEKTHLFT